MIDMIVTDCHDDCPFNYDECCCELDHEIDMPSRDISNKCPLLKEGRTVSLSKKVVTRRT